VLKVRLTCEFGTTLTKEKL
jgi:ubiquilin